MTEYTLNLDLLRISMQEVLLTLLENKDLYGKQMVEIISEASKGVWIIETASIYPTLRKMQSKGLVDSYWDDEACDSRGGQRRRYYTITKLGKDQLSAIGGFRSSLQLALLQIE